MGRRGNHFTIFSFYLVSGNCPSSGYFSLEEPIKWKIFRERLSYSELIIEFWIQVQMVTWYGKRSKSPIMFSLVWVNFLLPPNLYENSSCISSRCTLAQMNSATSQHQRVRPYRSGHRNRNETWGTSWIFCWGSVWLEVLFSWRQRAQEGGPKSAKRQVLQKKICSLMLKAEDESPAACFFSNSSQRQWLGQSVLAWKRRASVIRGKTPGQSIHMISRVAHD